MTQPPTGVPGTAPAVLTNEKLLHRLSHPTVHDAPKRRKNPPDPNRSRPQRPKTRRKKGRRR
jgi:hypothetical protein